jgi:cell division protein FtsQ
MASGAERTTAAGPPPRSGSLPAPISRGRKVAAISIIALLLLAAGAVALTRTALFRAKTIGVHGASHISRADVLRISGIDSDTNVFTLDGAAAERRLERNPWVADATVTKDLPSTVSIAVHERVAVAVAESGGVLRLVGDDGTLLDLALPRTASGLTRIASAFEGAAEPTVEAIGGAARAIAAMTPAVRHRVSVVTILADGQLRVDLSSGVEVAYGPASETIAKAQALRALLDWATIQGSSLAAADVRFPSAPTAELVGGGATVP